MNESDKLRKAAADIAYVLEEVPGSITAKGRRQEPRVDVARNHMRVWRTRLQPGDASRGGSSSPREEEERQENNILARAADVNLHRLVELSSRIARDSEELASLVAWGAEEVHPSKLPADVTPGCQNPKCDQLLEPGRESGECGRCRVHRHRHGLPWPERRVDARQAS